MDESSPDPDLLVERSFSNRGWAALLAILVIVAGLTLAFFFWPKPDSAAARPMLFLRMETRRPGLPPEIERDLTQPAEEAVLALPEVGRTASYTDSTGASLSIGYRKSADLAAAEANLRRAVEGLRDRLDGFFERYSIARKTTPYNWPVKPSPASAP